MITFPGSFLSDCRHVLILSAVGGGCGKSRQACARQQTCRKGREDQPSTALSQFFPCQKPTNSGGSSYAVGSGTHRRGLMRKRRGKPRLSDPGGAIGKLPGVGHRPRPPGVAPSARALPLRLCPRAGSIFLNANSIEPAGIMFSLLVEILLVTATHRSMPALLHEDGARDQQQPRIGRAGSPSTAAYEYSQRPAGRAGAGGCRSATLGPTECRGGAPVHP